MGLCTELEKQIQDMEDIQARYEENEGRWKSDKYSNFDFLCVLLNAIGRTTYERAVGEREDEVMKMQCALKMEKIGRWRLHFCHLCYVFLSDVKPKKKFLS